MIPAVTRLLESLSNKNLTFFIPPYQRNYEWSTEYCDRLLDDLRRVADQVEAGERAEHFFGSIVFTREDGGGWPEPDRYNLTDGQQRITTTMLLLMAIRDSSTDESFRAAIQRSYVQNENTTVDGDYKIKLQQVESDWEAYKRVALGEKISPAQRNSVVYRNYSHFREMLRHESDARLKSLVNNGLAKFSVITIELEPIKNEWENPQEIFESMNSLGKPLSLADLVRNYLLMGKSSRDQTALYNRHWMRLEELIPGKISDFIRDWMQADRHRSFLKATESNHKRLYAEFKELARERNTEELLAEFTSFVGPYAIVIGNRESGNQEIDQLLSDIERAGVTTATSLLSELFRRREQGVTSDLNVIGVLKALRTYFIRRRILGLTTAENKWLPTLGPKLDAVLESSDPTSEMFKVLSSYEYALRLPNDDEVRQGLASMNFYNWNRGRSAKFILAMLENVWTKSRPDLDDEKLQLEHILPQTLTSEWRQMLGPEAEKVHQDLVNSLGNITLIRHNQELGNKPFNAKVKIYESNAGLQIARTSISDVEIWDENAIRRRTAFLT